MGNGIDKGSLQAQQFVEAYDCRGDKGPDGALDREEFRFAFENGIRGGDELLSHWGCANADELFDKIDKKRNGNVTPMELDRIFGRTPPPSAAEVVDDLLTWSEGDGLTGSELASVYQEVTLKYGQEVADEVFTQALGARVDQLTLDGVEWLQKHHGAIGGHVDSYQMVLTHTLTGAKILDADFDGELDPDDLVFTEDPDGNVHTQRIGEALCNRVRIAVAIVDACEAMDNAKHDFALTGDTQFNPEYWQGPDDVFTFRLKEGQSPSEAVEDIFKNPDKYKFECATANVIVYYKAMLDLIGPNDFDRIAQDIRIGPWHMEGDLADVIPLSGDVDAAQNGTPKEATPERLSELQPGDWTYIMNWDVSESGAAGGWGGENVIFLGNGLYYGHPFGISTEQEIVAFLNKHRREGSSRSASPIDLQRNMHESVLDHDLDPSD